MKQKILPVVGRILDVNHKVVRVGQAAAVRALLSRLPLLLLPLALFLALFHPATLDIGNAGWLIRGSDNGENALGTHAWLHDPAPGVLRTHLLNAPEGVPLLFTDSNPLIGAMMRPIASLLPADAQFVGPWILLCLFLQVFFAWLLLKKFAPGPIALWCGVVLLAAPPTLANRYVHANLMAHWLILWALWRFLDPGRAGSNRGWAVLLLIAALVHNYLLMMVGAIWLTAMTERFAVADRRDRAVLAGGTVAILAMVAGLAWLLGAGEAHALAGNYGAFAMPIDAPINPGTPAYSQLLPSVAQRAGRGFEGFQYLGAGLLLLLPIAAAVAWKRPADDQRAPLRRLRWLIPALVVLTLLAISNYPDIAGQMLPRLPLPSFLIAALDLVRASGRLFWPVAYVLVLLAILAVYRLPRAQADGLLALLLAVQILDLSGMAAVVRAQSAEAGVHRLYVLTPDPRWGRAIAAARDVTFVPPDATRDLSLFQEVAWRAVGQGKPVRLVYAARDSVATVERQRRELAAFAAGQIDPHRLYVLAPDTAVPAAAAARFARIDNIPVILPVGALTR
jgi:hypothetical protein